MMNYLTSLLTTHSTSLTADTQTTTKVILVRHGRTTYNEQGRYQGNSDESVLTAKGIQDAYATGLALQGIKFDAIYTSPLRRVQQTTQEIITAFQRSPGRIPEVSIDQRLREISMSDWQGLLYQEVKEQYPDDYHCWKSTPHLFTRNQINYPVLELFAQAQQFWQEVLKKHRGQTILVVAHGGTNKALIGTAIALLPKYYHSLQQSNCGISYLELSTFSPGFGQLKYLNITDHLTEKLPKLKASKTGWRWLLISNEITKNKLKLSYLSRLEEQTAIDLVLTDNTMESELLAANFMKHKNKILHLSTTNSNFCNDWQKNIINRQKINNNSSDFKLFTGLIIASNKLLSQILHQTIDTNTSWKLTNHLAVIHYPDLECRSILQGILPLRFDRDENFKSIEEVSEVLPIER